MDRTANSSHRRSDKPSFILGRNKNSSASNSRHLDVSFDDRLKTGQFGERIVDDFLKQKNWVPYRPQEGVAHPFDRLAASADKRKICIVEVKTKWRREAYADTGINRRHFDDYQQITMKYGLPLFLSFVDAKLGTVYGNWWLELLKTREPSLNASSSGCKSYPWEHKGIVYFPISAMRTLYVLSENERAELLGLRCSNWKQDSVLVR